jgi:hypothetical protein
MTSCRLATSPRLLRAYFCLPLAALSLSLFANPARSQSDAGAPPPAHLPRFVFECEAAPGYSSCSLWTWHGSSYSAIWTSGEIGQLTVDSGDRAASEGIPSGGNAAELRVRRTDTAGHFPGLTATYTGKWDGTHFTDGKMTYAFKGTSGTGTWTLTREVTPVVHTTLGTVQTVTQDEIYGVGRRPGMYYNWYTAPLTGFAIHSNGMLGSGVTTVIDDFRLKGVTPMNPGERRLIDMRSVMLRPNYEKGAVYFPGSTIAAIFADGTTFGDRIVLSAMIDYRRSMLAALTGIGATLCTLGTRQSDIAAVDAALSQQQAAQDARSAADKAPRGAAYAYVGKFMHGRGNARQTASQITRRTWDAVNKLRSGLADPVKDSSGQPAFASVTPLACRWP